MPRHFHDEIQIGVCEGGMRRMQIGAHVHEATVGHIVVIPSGHAHAILMRAGNGATGQVIFVPPSRFAAEADELGVTDRELKPLAGRLPAYWRALTLSYALAHGTALEQATLWLELVHELLQVASSPIRNRAEPFAIRLAEEYLRAHYAETVSLDDLAFQVGLNKYYLVRAFRKTVGVPPHTYQIQLRIAEAKLQLAAGRPASEIAVMLGFADQSHFVRTFRRYVGIAPGRYRRCFVASP